MNPMIRRQQAAQMTIDRFHGKPLSYGKDDCARMTVFCLKKLGLKVSLLKAGAYKSHLGSVRALKRLGFANISEAVDALGLPRIAPAMCLPGDIMALPSEEGDELALAVAVGNGRVLAFWAGSGSVCTVVQPLKFTYAWRSI
jgi:hypothetical protein